MESYIFLNFAATLFLQVGQEAGGPRQPWHDWHCKIEGPAAYDILINFEQRWRKLLSNIHQKWRKATHRHDDDLIRIERISWILGPKLPFPPEGDPKLYVTKDDDPDAWHIQVSLLSLGPTNHSPGSFCATHVFV